ncbi:RrF2 family transcriptional regulator [Adhaeribacter rhizoryzae]|uniref:Rrf2 family transcriptional regulator n=1 Tax=Adhaeribacter rhizoryzae TaxID=2607907 RepID=A0A5M6D458_9BACT|nr:Rrf2 family transcriptional regulator [Adhaeribacter rhizoryzae]KAA5539965.1 Rrf2 family transcriptional regulator [Adhaeribacter rhizoryzae]
MLTKTSEYALRSIVYVAMQAAEGKKIGIKEIAKELELPLHFIGKILQDLVRKSIISSVKGPNGGFYLSRTASEITIMDVVRVIDGVEAFKKCGLGLKQCSDSHPCPLHNDFKKYRDGLAALFSTKTIQDLVQDVQNGQAYIRNNNEAGDLSLLTISVPSKS